MAELTPMMKQYLEIKKDNPDSILFFRLGDFYEMFADDEMCIRDRSTTCGSTRNATGETRPMETRTLQVNPEDAEIGRAHV